MSDWYLAPSLQALFDQANATALNRSRASDGTLGDAAHSARTSDHNPKPDGHGGWVVDAADLTHDPAGGMDAHGWIRRRCEARDPRIKYAISNARIWTPTAGWVTYTGANPHRSHVHVSVKASDAARRDTSPWGFGGTPQEDDDMTDAERALLATAAQKATDAVNYAAEAQPRIAAAEAKAIAAVNYAVDAQSRLSELESLVRAIAAKVGA